MPPRAVLDVNVLVSGVLGASLGRQSPPVTVLLAALEAEYRMVASPALLEAFHAVLRRPKFALGPDLPDRWAQVVGDSANVVRTSGWLDILQRDPADNEVLECALVGAVPFLVTGNLRHFEELGRPGAHDIVYRKVRIHTPRVFVESVLRRRPQ